MRNIDIRDFAKENGVCLWQIAEALQIPDSSLSRKLRRELTALEKDRFKKIIQEKAGEPR